MWRRLDQIYRFWVTLHKDFFSTVRKTEEKSGFVGSLCRAAARFPENGKNRLILYISSFASHMNPAFSVVQLMRGTRVPGLINSV